MQYSSLLQSITSNYHDDNLLHITVRYDKSRTLHIWYLCHLISILVNHATHQYENY